MVSAATARSVGEIGLASSNVEARPIYLDNHASTPVDPRVVRIVLHAMTEAYGNANSVDHAFGEVAAGLVAAARESVANLVHAEPDDIRFTSGATEAVRLALTHARADHSTGRLRIALTRVEHRAVLDAVAAIERSSAADVLWIDVDSRARILPGSLDAAIQSDADLVCLIAANNEVGTINPISEVAARIHARGGKILVDGTQAAGRIELRARDWELDYLTLSAHKLYGPKGVGALVAPGIANPRTDLIFGHEGTLNVPGIAGFGEACRLRCHEMSDDEPRIAALRDRLEAALQALVPGLVVNGDREQRLSHNLSIAAPGAVNDAVMARLRRKVAISTGAACSAGTDEPSHVLRAMGLSEDIQESALRIGVGKFNTNDEIDRAAVEVAEAIRVVRASMEGRSR